MSKAGERLYNGIIKENPTFVLMLGMCPTLAVTTSAMNGLGMGLTTTVILAMSNLMISALRKVIPNGVYQSLGIYIPLIVVNCIILGRAEAYASFNPVIPSFFDGVGMGLGFTIGLASIGIVRELIGAGTIFGVQVMPSFYQPITIFILAPGAFLVLSLLTAAQNRVKRKMQEKGKETKIGSGCTGECASCASSCKGGETL